MKYRLAEDWLAREYVEYYSFFVNLTMTGIMGDFIEYRDEDGMCILKVMWKDDDHALVWSRYRHDDFDSMLEDEV
tara:strand:- start:11487 stop:11711 length:225 start_codon:yes stop_codon:yes gene_type:complete